MTHGPRYRLAFRMKAIRDLKVGSNRIPSRELKHLPMRAVSFLVQIFNAALRHHHLPPVWKHVRVISILKPGKDPAHSKSYRPIILLDTIGKQKILLTRILHEVGELGLRDEHFGFQPSHSTSQQLVRLVERITRNFGVKRLTGVVFLDVDKAFDTVWVDGLLYKLMILNSSSYLVHVILS
jgi:hypothetical protein